MPTNQCSRSKHTQIFHFDNAQGYLFVCESVFNLQHENEKLSEITQNYSVIL